MMLLLILFTRYRRRHATLMFIAYEEQKKDNVITAIERFALISYAADVAASMFSFAADACCRAAMRRLLMLMLPLIPP